MTLGPALAPPPPATAAPRVAPTAPVVMNALWIGPPAGALVILCLLSAVRAGHPVRLWS